MVCSDRKIAWTQREQRFYVALEKVWGLWFEKVAVVGPQVTVNRLSGL